MTGRHKLPVNRSYGTAGLCWMTAKYFWGDLYPAMGQAQLSCCTPDGKAKLICKTARTASLSARLPASGHANMTMIQLTLSMWCQLVVQGVNGDPRARPMKSLPRPKAFWAELQWETSGPSRWFVYMWDQPPFPQQWSLPTCTSHTSAHGWRIPPTLLLSEWPVQVAAPPATTKETPRVLRACAHTRCSIGYWSSMSNF